MAHSSRFDIQPGQMLKRRSRQESTALADAWMRVFGQKPAPHLNPHMWHVFSDAVYPSQDHQAVLDAYAECRKCAAHPAEETGVLIRVNLLVHLPPA